MFFLKTQNLPLFVIQRLPKQEVAYSPLTALSGLYIHKLVRLLFENTSEISNNVFWQGDSQFRHMLYEATLVSFEPPPASSYGRSYLSCPQVLPCLLSLKLLVLEVIELQRKSYQQVSFVQIVTELTKKKSKQSYHHPPDLLACLQKKHHTKTGIFLCA